MPSLRRWARQQPQKAAVIVLPANEILTYRELDRRASVVAQLLTSMGLTAGDGIAILLDNESSYLEFAWAARRCGAYYTPISTHLKALEAAEIVRDSGAKCLFAAASYAEVVEAILANNPHRCVVYALHGPIERAVDYTTAIEGLNGTWDVSSGPMGRDFIYSSGSTGKPKGIKHPLEPVRAQSEASGDWLREKLGLAPDTVYLSPAPLYHGAPLRFTMRTIECGGTAVILKKFAAQEALAAIERYGVTHSQWVPTMFFRLLQLSEPTRARYDLSSHRCAIHAAAPCPPILKEAMIAWWGPIVWEYYAGSERNGATCISSAEWLARRGSVGRACVGTVHILDDSRNELGPGQVGAVYFDGPPFVYHNDPQKTLLSRDARGWSTIGDVGYLDEQGYLYLTGRRSDLIITGGVNIYPAEIENQLLRHPLVADVAVIGIPSVEYGEEVKAVVQLTQPASASADLARQLIDFCRGALSHIKCPRSVAFEEQLPRLENGKLMKQVLRERYAVSQAGGL